MLAWIAVLIGFSPNSFLNRLLSIPKVKLDPPIRIIRGEGVFSSKLSLSIFENSRDFLVLGVAGTATEITETITAGINRNINSLDR